MLLGALIRHIQMFASYAYLFAIFVLCTVPSLGHAACITETYRVNGTSMSPRLANGALVKVAKWLDERDGCAIRFEVGNVVLIKTDSAAIPLLKAIRALPGDRVAMRDGNMMINGAASRNSQGEKYRLSAPRAAMIELYAHDYSGVIPRDHYLVMGEDPAGTTDSSRFGLIGREKIVGWLIESPR